MLIVSELLTKQWHCSVLDSGGAVHCQQEAVREGSQRLIDCSFLFLGLSWWSFTCLFTAFAQPDDVSTSGQGIELLKAAPARDWPKAQQANSDVNKKSWKRRVGARGGSNSTVLGITKSWALGSARCQTDLSVCSPAVLETAQLLLQKKSLTLCAQ